MLQVQYLDAVVNRLHGGALGKHCRPCVCMYSIRGGGWVPRFSSALALSIIRPRSMLQQRLIAISSALHGTIYA